MAKVSKKKHKDKNDITWYRHPVYIWLWFALIDQRVKCRSSKIIPPYSNRPTITDTPQLDIKGVQEHTGVRVVITSHKGFKYRINFNDGYLEAKEFESDRELYAKKKKKVVNEIKKVGPQDAQAFLSSIVDFNTKTVTEPFIDEGYQLFFDIPLPWYYTKKKQLKIDYSKIHQLESGVWSAKINGALVGAWDDPQDAYSFYLKGNK